MIYSPVALSKFIMQELRVELLFMLPRFYKGFLINTEKTKSVTMMARSIHFQTLDRAAAINSVFCLDTTVDRPT